MSTNSKRPNAGTAVAGLFDRASTTGGLAGREAAASEPALNGHGGQPTPGVARPARQTAQRADRQDDATSQRPPRARRASAEPRVRLGVELTEREVAFLRSLSRPARTGEPRTLGGKFVATGVLAAAIELLRTSQVDMHGVAAGDLEEMTARARAALLAAGGDGSDGGER